MSEMLRVCVVGAGSLGTYFATRLASTPSTAVTLVRRSRGDGKVCSTGPGTVTVDLLDGSAMRAEVTDVAFGLDNVPFNADIHPFDLTLVTVKNKDTKDIGTQLARAAEQGLIVPDRSLVVSLQNGMGNADIIADALKPYPGIKVLQGLTYLGASVVGEQHVRFNGPGITCVGPESEPALQAFAKRLNQSSIMKGLMDAEEVMVSDDVRSMVWTKLLVNSILNPVTAMIREKNGCLLREELRPLIQSACDEFEQIVAHEDGVRLLTEPHGSALNLVLHVARLTQPNTSSMFADVLAGRETEIEAINGFLTRRADEHQIQVPVLEGLYKIILGLQQKQ
mmetsp:Transcript_19724/g.38596  ORF Transcript_19724/g.38596 Transcript_19724/m.38596 type:complete len:337 (-) Transcript_19724:951-1961(-)|eukprot:CAMPEP_0171567640 /NCGR_PEP_ID=MMETSP0961-20121227/1277_1 /TAXON_ID=87120 /ORGANISM="Aurantiochytrium limacinum, Strain ATCCMYA-1381" /LENGTH=336 /DNA_ID=CAMNT_0012121593 /DNA_START=85 /DNA_END=1095 /DNA_ORIENTATION=+